jgi:cytochrome c biogenesis protein CcmG/thiol:disulfide interchange protein DsbE
MRRISILWIFVLLFSLNQCSKPDLPQIGQHAPEFTLKNLNGDKIKLLDLSQKGTVLVNFWASWCAPCKEEVPTLNEIQRKYRDRGLTVVGVSVEDPAPAVVSFMKRHNVQYSVLLDSDGRVSRRYGLIGFPTNILIDRQGKILFLKPGLIDEKEMAAMVEGSGQVSTQ